MNNYYGIDIVVCAFQVQPTYTFRVSPDSLTKDFLDMAIAKLAQRFVLDEPPESYVLKVRN